MGRAGKRLPLLAGRKAARPDVGGCRGEHVVFNSTGGTFQMRVAPHELAIAAPSPRGEGQGEGEFGSENRKPPKVLGSGAFPLMSARSAWEGE